MTRDEPRGIVARALRRPWWTLPCIGLAAMLPLIVRRVGDPDYWWHVRTGQWMVHNHAIARSELYTYTVPATPWTDHEYLSQLLFYALSRVGGLLAVSIVFGLVVWAGFMFVHARIRERDHAPLIAGVALLLGAAAGVAVWGPRPQMFDFAFGAVALFLLERFLAGRSRALYFLPLIVVVWANLHGGFVFSLFFLVLAVAAELLRWLVNRNHLHLFIAGRVALVALASAVASLLTPNGPALFVYVLRTQFSSQLSGFVREWQSPDFHMLAMLPFEVLLFAVLVGLAWRRPRLHDVLFVVGSAVMALHALLFIPMFVVAAVPVVAWQWSEPWERFRAWLATTRIGRPRAWAGEVLLLLLAIALLGGAGAAAYTLRGQTAATRANYPVDAADWLEAHPQVATRMLNEYSWGGYIIYRFYPDPNRRVFIYGESELMGDALLKEYADINNLRPGWQDDLIREHVNAVLFPPDAPIVAALTSTGAWHFAYADSVAVILTLSGTPSS